MNGIHEVTGSIPVWSTTSFRFRLLSCAILDSRQISAAESEKCVESHGGRIGDIAIYRSEGARSMQLHRRHDRPLRRGILRAEAFRESADDLQAALTRAFTGPDERA
jgi:hypothetical protein